MNDFVLPLAHADAEATARAALLDAWAEHAGAAVALKDAGSGLYVAANAGFLRAVDCTEVVGRSDAELFEAPVAAALRAADQTAQAAGRWLASEHRFESKGRKFDYTVLRAVVGDASRRVLATVWLDHAAAKARDAQLRQALEQIEQQHAAMEKLRREVQDAGLRDRATGLYTRAHFDDQLRREVDLSTREHREFALVAIELDPASGKAAALGEAGRGRVLEVLGGLLRGNTRAMDASCRVDASRFAVLLSGVGLATAHARMEGLRRQCATQIVVLEGQEFGFTVSMGVASFPHTAHTHEEIEQACERALDEAKRRGGNHVTLASIRFEPM